MNRPSLALITSSLALTAISLAIGSPAVGQGSAPYRVAQKFPLGANGLFDYMTFDPVARAIFIAQDKQVLVFDVASGKVTGKLNGMNHVHGVLFDPNATTAYVTDGGANIVQAFDRTTLAKLETFAAGTDPDGMVIEPTTGHLFVFNGKSANLTVSDLETKKMIAAVSLPGKPEFPTADGKGHVFVNIEPTHQVVKFNAADNKITDTWTINGCEAPTGMAIDPGADRIFPVCDNGKMPVIDTESGKTVAMPSIGEGSDAVVYDPERHLVISSNGDDGLVTIVSQDSPDHYRTVQRVKTMPQARTLAYDAETGDIYTVAPNPAKGVRLEKDTRDPTIPLVLIRLTRQ